MTHIATTPSPVDSLLLRSAGVATLAAAVLIVLTAILLALAFSGASNAFGPANDILFAVALLLLIPAVEATRRLARARVGPWFGVVSILAMIGIVVLVVGQTLLVAGVITIGPAFVAVGIGLASVLVWGIACAWLARHGHAEVSSRRVAWWTVACGGAVLASSIAWFTLDLAAWSVFGLAEAVTFVGWLVALGVDLIKRAA